MLARCAYISRQMVNSSCKIFLKRDHLSLMSSLAYTPNINAFELNIFVKRSYVRIPDPNQVKKEEKKLGLDIDVFNKKDIELMFEPVNYYLAMPKENIRSHFLKGFNYWMNVPDDILKAVEEVCIIYYETIVMSDDIYDQSDYRRGLPPSYKIFGAPLTYVSSKACLFLIMKKLIEFNNIKAIEIFVDSFLKFCVPAYKEIYLRDNMICPNMDEYEQSLCIDKAAGIVGLPIKLMQLYSNCNVDYRKLLNLLCLHQIYQNDIMNLIDEKCWDIKGFCDDISEGKYTLAAIHAINSGTFEGEIVFNIYRRKTKDLPTLKYCLSLMKKLGSIDFAKKATEDVENKLREEIENLGGNPPLTEYVNTISSWGYDEKIPKN